MTADVIPTLKMIPFQGLLACTEEAGVIVEYGSKDRLFVGVARLSGVRVAVAMSCTGDGEAEVDNSL